MSYFSQQGLRYIGRDVKQTDCFRYCVDNNVTVPVCMRSSVIITTLHASHVVTETREKVSVNNTNLAPHTVTATSVSTTSALVCVPEANSVYQTSALCSRLCYGDFCTPNCSSVLWSVFQKLLHTKLQLCALVCAPGTSAHQTAALCSGLCSGGFSTPNCSFVPISPL